jgi:hypothetical protein
MASDLTQAGAVWSKSSYSDGSGNNCVEVAAVAAGVGVRDSKNECGPALVVSAPEWGAFVSFVRSGALDFGVIDV